jgi:hypothetical protein
VYPEQKGLEVELRRHGLADGGIVPFVNAQREGGRTVWDVFAEV